MSGKAPSSPVPAPKPYTSIESIASRLGLPTAYLKGLADAGRIPFLEDPADEVRYFEINAVRDRLHEIGGKGVRWG